jgi:hypothetical protein
MFARRCVLIFPSVVLLMKFDILTVTKAGKSNLILGHIHVPELLISRRMKVKALFSPTPPDLRSFPGFARWSIW